MTGTNKPVINLIVKTTVLSMKCLINAASVLSLGDAEGA